MRGAQARGRAAQPLPCQAVGHEVDPDAGERRQALNERLQAGGGVRVIMVNLFVDGARKHSRWSRVAPLLQHADLTPDPANQVSDRDAMLTALQSLSPRQRTRVVPRHYEDLPVAKVAAVIGGRRHSQAVPQRGDVARGRAAVRRRKRIAQ